MEVDDDVGAVTVSGHSMPVVCISYGWRPAWANTGLGFAESRIVSDLVRSMNRNPVEGFWTSALPPDNMFLAATHQPLGSWLETGAR